MDIITHAGIGLIAAAPLLNSHPELAVGVVAGSVLPDLDALSRVFGKHAYLRMHQTWSHAIPVQGAVSVLVGVLTNAGGADGLSLGAGLFAGLAFHTLLDFTNTLGMTLLAPFSRKRFCREWVFFIDAVIVVLTLLAASFTVWTFLRTGEVPPGCAAGFFTLLAAYLAGKAMLRRRAGTLGADAVTLVPSALYPCRFLGVAQSQRRAELFQINAITGKRQTLCEQHILDAVYAGLLAKVPEFALMRSLSPAYHVVKVLRVDAGEKVFCRDLRTRNFRTTFGDLDILLDSEKRVRQINFHV